MPEALAALSGSDKVGVETRDGLAFMPRSDASGVGLVLYSGGYVDPRAYAPAALALAERGHLVVLPRMPFGLAFSNVDAATFARVAYPTVRRWVVGGHSLGGVVAALHARNHQDTVSGLVLWASYPADDTDLSPSGLRVTSISGTRDGLTTQARLEATDRLLPPSASRVRIEGGNHAQFGWYGEQEGDLAATLERTEQQERTVTATAALLDGLR